MAPGEYEKETRRKVEGLETKMDKLNDGFHSLEIKVIKAINHLSNRLPYWAVLIIALLSTGIGWLIKLKI